MKQEDRYEGQGFDNHRIKEYQPDLIEIPDIKEND